MLLIQNSLLKLVVLVIINIIVSTAYIAYKNYTGYFWANVFIYASTGLLPFFSVLLVLSSWMLLALSIWRACNLNNYLKRNQYINILIRILLTIVSIYIISKFNLVSALSLVSIFGLQHGAGYQP